MFRKRSVYEKGDSISNCIFDGHQFPDMRICEGEGENLSGLFLEICGSCQNYIGLCRYVQGEKEPEGHCDCSHGTKGGSSVKTLCHPDGSAKVTGGTTAAGSVKAVAVSDGMAFRDGTAERDVTLRMARILKKKLLAEGYDVLMVRDGKDVQLDNVARTVICNNVADCHIALHWDSDGLSYDKGCFYASVPKQLKNRKPVAFYWKEHDALGKALIKGLRSKKVKISGTGAAEIDLTQTSYSTIPSVDIELGNQCSDHSDKKMEKLADGLLRGINSYAKKYIHVAPLSSL